MLLSHPAGDVTRVFVVSGNVTVKIGNAEKKWRGCRDKNLINNQTFLFVYINWTKEVKPHPMFPHRLNAKSL